MIRNVCAPSPYWAAKAIPVPIGQRYIAVNRRTRLVDGYIDSQQPQTPGSFPSDGYVLIPVSAYPAMGTVIP